jgi:cytochrome d ubiquinol oxidase subunit I
VIVAIMETLYVRSGRELYKEMAKFWGKLFLINFAMGVVTGIVMEFQFGMNWSEYSRFVGDIFGAPLAIEALLAFFLESTFLGVWVFGWEKLSKGMHAAAIWMVALGSNISALWILIANSFMQEPVGYVIRNGRAEMADFFALLLNPNVLVQFPHVVFAGLTTGAFFVLGISTYQMIKKNRVDMFRQSFQIAATIGTIAVILVVLNGHSQTQEMVRSQPMKMAAAEALWETEDPASFSVLTIGDLEQRRDVFAIRLPRLLSLLAYNQLDGTVKGIHNLQEEYVAKYGEGNYIPPVAVTYWSFRLMVGAGFLMLALALYALLNVMGGMFEDRPRVLQIFTLAIALPYIANTTGWMMAELGRAPWVVYGVMKIEDAVSPTVSGGAVLATLIGFTLVYAVLIVADVYLLVKYAKSVPGGAPGTVEEGELIPSLTGAQD